MIRWEDLVAITVKRCPYCSSELCSRLERFRWKCDKCTEHYERRLRVALEYLKGGR